MQPIILTARLESSPDILNPQRWPPPTIAPVHFAPPFQIKISQHETLMRLLDFFCIPRIHSARQAQTRLKIARQFQRVREIRALITPAPARRYLPCAIRACRRHVTALIGRAHMKYIARRAPAIAQTTRHYFSQLDISRIPASPRAIPLAPPFL